MALMDFIKKQFIDIIQWTEDGEGTLAWRFPMRDMEIQYGASLTVRESQMAVFVDEGRVADVFGPGMYKLTTQTIPVLTYLKNWDKLFESPFKSDVYFFSMRQQVDRRWGTPQPITIRDKEFGAVRLRAFGNYTYRIADPKVFHTSISGTRDIYTVGDLDGLLRGMFLQHISDAIAESKIPFLDLAANQIEFAAALATELLAPFAAIGLKLEAVTVQNLSLPEELQKVMDQRIGMGMVGGEQEQRQHHRQHEGADLVVDRRVGRDHPRVREHHRGRVDEHQRGQVGENPPAGRAGDPEPEGAGAEQGGQDADVAHDHRRLG
jgi:membrane protease subunit (stomatin/prohibitin family)